MADKGTVGSYLPAYIRPAALPRNRQFFGALSITGTAQKSEVAAPARIDVFSARMQRLMAVQAKSDGSMAIYNLAAGRYFIVVDGEQWFLPGVYAVDVS